MTFNIRGGLGMDGRRSLERVAEVIREQQPDLAGLQEVHCRLPWSGMTDQPRRLARLTGLLAYFLSSFSLGFGGYGNLWLTRHPQLRLRRQRLPGGREPRAVLWLELPLGRTVVRAFVTHFGLDAGEKPLQAARLARLVASCAGPVLVAGDLNARPGSPELSTLLDVGLRHAVPPDDPTYPADSPRDRIDYLLVSRHWDVASPAVLPTLASDHLPLVADLSLAR
jgi:endonuclease/exonuclease/phosphatase family metal-dependent hydrolase